MCLQCVHYITGAYSFKQLCERSEITLRQLLGKNANTSSNTTNTTTFHELKPCDPETSSVLLDEKSINYGNILNSVENVEGKLVEIVEPKFILEQAAENVDRKLNETVESKYILDQNMVEPVEIASFELDQNSDPLSCKLFLFCK